MHIFFIQLDVFNYGIVDATYRENGKKCKLTLGRNPISFFAPVVFPMAKNGPYSKAISEAYMKLYKFIVHSIFLIKKLTYCFLKGSSLFRSWAYEFQHEKIYGRLHNLYSLIKN